MNNNNQTRSPLNLEVIAEKANVSRSTVSRVINNQPYVSEKTRARVMAVIEAVGFSPNPAARMLVTQRTEVIGVVIPAAADLALSDAYHFQVLQGIAKATNEQDYSILLWMRDLNSDVDSFYKRILRSRLVDGIVLGAVTTDSELIEQLNKNGTPYATIDRPYDPAHKGFYVTVDNVTATCTLIEHLIKQGRRRIGTVAGPQNNVDGIDRLAGYRHALEGAGLMYDPEIIYEGDFTRQSGYKGTKHILNHDLDAIFASNDLVALGVLEALAEAGLRVPEDIAVVGFDDLPTSSRTVPPLTTVRQPVQEKAELATRLLIDSITDKPVEHNNIILPTQLIIRESCGASSL